MIRIGHNYFDYLIDDFGIWQHSKGLTIDKKHGYALDDSARALLLALKSSDERKMTILSANVLLCLSEDGSNFYDKNRRPLGIKVTEDAFGEAMWALTEYQKIKNDQNLKTIIIDKFNDARGFVSIRGWSYLTMASSVFDKSITTYFGEKILNAYQKNRKNGWEWPESKLTYANAIMPMALMRAYNQTGKFVYLQTGFRMLDFLNNRAKAAKIPISIGNNGWYQKGSKKALYGQQPIDIAYQTMANLLAYEISLDQKYLLEARNYFSWFWGNNIQKVKMIDIRNERCLDGFNENYTSNNCGAESIICFLLAQEEIWPYLTGEKQ